MRSCSEGSTPIALVGIEVSAKLIYDRPALEETLLRALRIGADDVHDEPVLVLAAYSLCVPFLELLPDSSLIRLRILQKTPHHSTILSYLNVRSYLARNEVHIQQRPCEKVRRDERLRGLVDGVERDEV